MQKNVFDFVSSKRFLVEWLQSQPGGGRGKRTELAQAMKCKLSYVSRILNGDAQLSVEQGEVLGRYFGFSKEEAEFFVLLVLKDRAGSENLRQLFSSQIVREQAKRKVLRDRIGVSEGMSELDRARYYSTWQYTAVHFLLTIPEFQTRAEITKRLNLKPKKVADILEFLVSAGLAVQEGDRFRTTKMKIHLGNDSPEIVKHHTHWRTRAAVACENESPEDLHYSSVVTLAKEDIGKIRELLVQSIERFREKIDPSPEEELCAICLDWFRV
ncbi:MAG: DUF4423 domain-containing protein [Bdellovibrionota bacterium]